jgi:hypothetical protein
MTMTNCTFLRNLLHSSLHSADPSRIACIYSDQAIQQAIMLLSPGVQQV